MKTQTVRAQTTRRAFTLLEVMFAMVVFCTAMFVILAMVSNLLTNARRLQQRSMVDAGVLAAELSQTNQLVEGIESGNLGDLLGNAYQGYTWKYDIQEVQTNKLFQVDFIIQSDSGDRPVVSQMSILLFRPNSPAGSLDGGPTLR
jgi:prepilin-type N-terminal cleavage/methylation domain-containing protein